MQTRQAPGPNQDQQRQPERVRPERPDNQSKPFPVTVLAVAGALLFTAYLAFQTFFGGATTTKAEAKTDRNEFCYVYSGEHATVLQPGPVDSRLQYFGHYGGEGECAYGEIVNKDTAWIQMYLILD